MPGALSMIVRTSTSTISVDGYMTLPDIPGLGLELRDDTIEKYGVKIG